MVIDLTSVQEAPTAWLSVGSAAAEELGAQTVRVGARVAAAWEPGARGEHGACAALREGGSAGSQASRSRSCLALAPFRHLVSLPKHPGHFHFLPWLL